MHKGVKFIHLGKFCSCIVLNFLLSSALPLIKNSYLGWCLDLWHKISGSLSVLGKNGLYDWIQEKKSCQNDELFFMGIEKVLKMQASVISKCFFLSFARWTDTYFRGNSRVRNKNLLLAWQIYVMQLNIRELRDNLKERSRLYKLGAFNCR